MIPFRLVRKNLFKHKLRAILTIASLAVAIFLLCVLRSMVVALDAGVRQAQANRIVVQSSVSLFVYLPESYTAKLRQVEGVQDICSWNWFGAYYQEPKNFFGQFATELESFLNMYPEVEIIDGSREELLKERQACILGVDTAKKYGFKVGDTIPLVGALFPRTDGRAYEFKLAAIYHSKKKNLDNNSMFFHAEYLRKALESHESQGIEGIPIFVLQVKPGVDPINVMGQIDAMFENGPQRVQSTSEAEFNAQFVSMVGNVPFFVASIGTGVLIAIVLASLNTMLMAAREQTQDVGVLKALGFTDTSVFGIMLTQALFLCGLGGALGITFAIASESWIAYKLGVNFPGYEVPVLTLLQGAALSLGVGLIAGIAPAWRARNLKVIDALRATA
jgi:putative ABC transport system permease protein